MAEAEKFKNRGEHLENIFNRWEKEGKTATKEKKDEIAQAYIIFILRLSKETAEKFARGDKKTIFLVRQAHKNVNPLRSRMEDFWKRFSEVFPENYTQDDIELLVKGSPHFAFSCIVKLHTRGIKKSVLLAELVRA